MLEMTPIAESCPQCGEKTIVVILTAPLGYEWPWKPDEAYISEQGLKQHELPVIHMEMFCRTCRASGAARMTLEIWADIGQNLYTQMRSELLDRMAHLSPRPLTEWKADDIARQGRDEGKRDAMVNNWLPPQMEDTMRLHAQTRARVHHHFGADADLYVRCYVEAYLTESAKEQA